MTSNIQKVLDGCIGFFYPIRKDEDLSKEGQRGYIKLNKEGILEIETLEEDIPNTFMHGHERGMPKWLFGETQYGGILIADTVGFGTSMNFGSSRASVNRYRARTLIYGVNTRELRSSNVTSVTFFFPDIMSWAKMAGMETKYDTDDDNRYKGLSITLASAPVQTVNLNRGRKLEMSTHWEVGGSQSVKTIFAPLEITCCSAKGRAVRDLAQPIYRIQDLVSTAFRGLVVAQGGRANTEKGVGSSAPEFWNSYLMSAQAGAILPKSMTEFPLFNLNDLGGLEGLRRWLTLYEAHPRAVQPVVRQWRMGNSSPEVRLMDIAAGIEYWTAAHARQAQWPKVKPQALAVARRAGKPFDAWVGGADEWADLFWDEYNAIKHRPKHVVDHRKAHFLAETGAILLTCVLLKRVAKSSAIVNVILSSHRLDSIGRTIRELIAEAKESGQQGTPSRR